MTKGGGGVGKMLIMADKGGREGLDPPFLADIICEQPLTSRIYLVSVLLSTLVERCFVSHMRDFYPTDVFSSSVTRI